MIRRFLPLVLAVALVAAACGDDAPVETGEGPGTTTTVAVTAPPPATPADRLAAARTQWATDGPEAYLLTTRELCFCPETIWEDRVVDGVVEGHTATTPDAFYDPGPRTMEDLFDEIYDVLAEDYATLDLEFDPETGAVVRYWVDVEEMMADEEHGVEVVSLVPFDPTIDPLDVDLGTLTVDYGCGYGFAIGSPDQTIALVISSGGFGTAPDVSAPVTFPSDGWTAELSIGTDLFSNWCDDVFEESEPVPVVEQTLMLVAGTLTIGLPGAATGETPVPANLSGGVVETTDGRTLDLGPVAFLNDCWGCFAG